VNQIIGSSVVLIFSIREQQTKPTQNKALNHHQAVSTSSEELIKYHCFSSKLYVYIIICIN